MYQNNLFPRFCLISVFRFLPGALAASGSASPNRTRICVRPSSWSTSCDTINLPIWQSPNWMELSCVAAIFAGEKNTTSIFYRQKMQETSEKTPAASWNNPANSPVLRLQKRCWSNRWSQATESWPLLQPTFMMTWLGNHTNVGTLLAFSHHPLLQLPRTRSLARQESRQVAAVSGFQVGKDELLTWVATPMNLVDLVLVGLCPYCRCGSSLPCWCCATALLVAAAGLWIWFTSRSPSLAHPLEPSPLTSQCSMT